jgi:Family of unknown function (DUF6169)
MEIDFSPYNFDRIDSEEFIYLFDTNFGLSYEVVFKPTPYLFSSDKPYSDDTYEFSIIVIENPNHASPPFDNRIGSTIAKIFDSFYEEFGNTVSLYICASHDNRQMVRFRKFNGWFSSFGTSKYVKLEAVPTDKNGNKFPLALVIRLENPYLGDIVTAFQEVVSHFQNDK